MPQNESNGYGLSNPIPGTKEYDDELYRRTKKIQSESSHWVPRDEALALASKSLQTTGWED